MKNIQKIFLLILIISLLTACSYSNGKNYEIYANSDNSAFEEFTDNLFKEEVVSDTLTLHYTLSNPSSYGISDYPITLGEVSSTKDYTNTLTQLRSFDYSTLSKEQQITYDVLEANLELSIDSKDYSYYSEPLQPLIGTHINLPITLSEYTFYTEQDVIDYLNLLDTVDEYLGSLLDYENQKSALGLFMKDDILEDVIEECNTIISDIPLYETFDSRLEELNLDNSQIERYQTQNKTLVEEVVIPAYKNLVQGLASLKGTGKNEEGICNLPKGKDYYELLVKSATGSDSSIHDLESLVYKQLKSDASKMQELLNKDSSLASQSETFSFALTEPSEILTNLSTKTLQDFPKLNTQISYEIKEVPTALQSIVSPAYYMHSPIDKPENNVIYINSSKKQSDTSNLYSTLAHEGIPGHLYQRLYTSEHQTSPLRSLLNWIGYTEGWAVYSEFYAYDLDNATNPSLNEVIRLNSSITMAVYCLSDMYINYDGWDMEEFKKFISGFFTLDDDSLKDFYNTFIARPTNYLEYYIGYLEIMNLKEDAMKSLGDDFNIKEFHTFLLDMGESPFWVIENHMKSWMKNQSS
jgi:uncharacterized protein (DUF885 family)